MHSWFDGDERMAQRLKENEYGANIPGGPSVDTSHPLLNRANIGGPHITSHPLLNRFPVSMVRTFKRTPVDYKPSLAKP